MTRILMLSDVHGNATALDAVLAAANGRWDRAVCLGDLVGYGPDPNEVIDKIRALDMVVVRGNHDKAAAGLTELDDFNPVAGKALTWTRSQLSPHNLNYLRKLPAGPLELDGMALVHGSPRDEDEYVFSPAQAYESLLEAQHDVTFFGHTHNQSGFAYREGVIDVLGVRPAENAGFRTQQLEPGWSYLLNPGSVGQPRDGDPRAAFALVDSTHKKVEFWRTAYDIAAVQRRMTEFDAPEMLVSRLEWGR